MKRHGYRIGFTLIELLLVITIIAIIAAIAIPNMMAARIHANEGAAIGAMKTIGTAQSVFREADKDRDDLFQYGNLLELSSTGLIDGVLGSGLKAGYRFDVRPSTATSEFLWFGVATPALPGSTGDRYYAANHSGVVFYTTTNAFLPNTTNCLVPTTGIPVGK